MRAEYRIDRLKEGHVQKRWAVCGVVAWVLALLPMSAWAQNTAFGTSVHMLVGQTPMVVTLPTATPDRFYDAPVVGGRSYCAEATGAETEVNQTDPVLVVYRNDQTTTLGTDTGTTTEPKGQTAARVCFIAPASEQLVYMKLSPNTGFADLAYTLRFVETTLWANWYFVVGDYSSFTLLRNTTNTAVNYTAVWRCSSGTNVGTSSGSIAGNGIVAINARSIAGALASGSGSVELAHDGSPEAIVGSQTTLSCGTGLSFDTFFFQR